MQVLWDICRYLLEQIRPCQYLRVSSVLIIYQIDSTLIEHWINFLPPVLRLCYGGLGSRSLYFVTRRLTQSLRTPAERFWSESSPVERVEIPFEPEIWRLVSLVTRNSSSRHRPAGNISHPSEPGSRLAVRAPWAYSPAEKMCNCQHWFFLSGRDKCGLLVLVPLRRLSLSSHLTSLKKAPPIIFHSTVSVTETVQIVLLLLQGVQGGGFVVAHIKSPVVLKMWREPSLPWAVLLWSCSVSIESLVRTELIKTLAAPPTPPL